MTRRIATPSSLFCIALLCAETETGRKLEGRAKRRGCGNMHAGQPPFCLALGLFDGGFHGRKRGRCACACMKGEPAPAASKLNPTRDGTFNGRNFQKHEKARPVRARLGLRRSRRASRRAENESPAARWLPGGPHGRVPSVFCSPFAPPWPCGRGRVENDYCFRRRLGGAGRGVWPAKMNVPVLAQSATVHG
jgi:hypothetical protein